jgi:NAD(P)-dependent dehydrogenase (short-subunit alcohol dehydrogenase family)
MKPLAGRRVLITAGHKRLGRAVAVHLAGLGADIAIHYRRDADLAHGCVEELQALGVHALALAAELTDPQQVRALVEDAVAALGGLDLLVAVAASYEPTDVLQTTAADLDRILAANARAPIELVLCCRPHLAQSGDGRAVLFGDLAGVTPLRGYLAHSMAKAALHAGVRGLAAELAPQVTVNAILPGAVLMPENLGELPWQALQRRVPMGSLALADAGEPVRAIVQAVEYLATCSRYVTGVLLPIEGGRLACW